MPKMGVMKADGLFEAVKQSVSMRAIAEQYGLEVRHGGMIVCPFHADKNPSMKLNEDYYYCFGCGATGDAIDFVAQLFGISIRQAAEKIADDFAISYDSRAIHAPPRKTATKTQIARQRELYTARVLSKYFRLLDGWLKEYSPQKPEDEIHPRFIEAVQRKDYVEYLMDVLICGTAEEKAEICCERNSDIRRIAHRLTRLNQEKPQTAVER